MTDVTKVRDVVELCNSRGHDMSVSGQDGEYSGKCRMCGMTVTIVDEPRPNEARVMGRAVAMDCPTLENSRLLEVLFRAYANVYGKDAATAMVQALRYDELEDRGVCAETLLSLGKHVRDKFARSNPYLYGRVMCLYAAAWSAGSAFVKLHSHIWEDDTFPYEDVANAIAFLEGGMS